MMVNTRNMGLGGLGGLGSGLPGVDIGLSIASKPTCFEAAATVKRCGFWSSLWNPECILAKQEDAACQLLDPDWYAFREYGTIPKPNPTTVPAIKPPVTPGQLEVPGEWTPGQSTPDPQAAADKLRDQIKAAEEAGTYTPYGGKTLMDYLFGGGTGRANPKLQEYWAEYKWWIAGGVVLYLAVTTIKSAGTAAGAYYGGVRGYR